MDLIQYMESPIGELGIVERNQAIVCVFFGGRIGKVSACEKYTLELEERRTELLAEAEKQLEEYFAGSRRRFALPLAPTGTGFQKRVWEALIQIPYGETRTYGEIAKTVGNPKGSRAVGMANHRNPIPIVIPCHRVIGAGGTLTGYAGGLDIKRKLLELEGSL